MSRPIVSDFRLLAAAGLLSLFGVAMVYSAGQTDTPTAVATVYKSQILWLLIGMGFAYAVGRSSVRFIEWMTTPLYLLSIFLLGLTLVIGKGAGTAASTKSWLAIGSHRIGQPSEIAKVTVVLMLAKVLSDQRETPKSLLDLWKPALVVGIPWAIIMLQPDLGTGIVFIGIFFAMLYWAGVAWPLLILIASPAISLILSFSVGLWGAWFFILLALVLWYRPYLIEGIVLMVLNVATGVIAPMMWEKLAPYQQNRLKVFIDPSADPRASGYHVIQSKIAIGSGRLFGKGYLHGTQNRLDFLPAQHTDFIFAVFSEEWGFVGCLILLVLYFALIVYSFRLIERAKDRFGGLLVFGMVAIFFWHVVINVAMVTGIMPVVGVPLPMVSYGGSSLASMMFALGVMINVSMRRYTF